MKINKYVSKLIDILFYILYVAFGFALFYGLYCIFVNKTDTPYNRETAIIFSAISGIIWCLIGSIGLYFQKRRKNKDKL